MSIDLKKIVGVISVSPLAQQNAYLTKFENSGLRKFTWKVIIEEKGGLEIYEMKNGGELSEHKALSCANILLAHLKQASRSSQSSALQITQGLENRSISYTDLTGKELSQLKKTGISLPITFESSSTYSENQIRNNIRNFDTFGIEYKLQDPLTKAIIDKVVAEFAQNEPHLIYALIFKLLSESKYGTHIELCRALCEKINRTNLTGLLILCRRNNLITSENVIGEALLYSGFSLKVLEILSKKGLQPNQYALQLAAIIGVEEVTLHLCADLKNVPFAIQSVCQDMDDSEIMDLVDKYRSRNMQIQYNPGEEFEASDKEKAAHFATNFMPENHDPVKLLETLIAIDPNHDPLAINPSLIGSLAASPLLANNDKIAMIDVLLKRHDEILLCQAEEKDAVAKAMMQSALDRINYLNAKVNGKSVLRTVVERGGDVELLTFLIGKGASIKELDSNQSTLLHTAASFNNLQALKLLEEMGLDKNQLDLNGAFAFDLLSTNPTRLLNGSPFHEIILFLLEKEFPYHSQKNEQIFAELIKLRQVGTAAQFFEKYPCASGVCTHLPALKWDMPVMISLIALAKANGENLDDVKVDAYDFKLGPLFFYAINIRNKELVKALLKAGVSCETRYQGRNPRVYAYQISDPRFPESVEIIEMIEQHLIAQGKILDDESTPYHLAVVKGDLEACKGFIEEEKRLPFDINGLTPVHYAIIHRQAELLSLFFEANKAGKITLPTPSFTTISEKHFQVIDGLAVGWVPVQSNKTYTRSSAQGGSLLALALAEGNFDAAEFLWNKITSSKTQKEERLREKVFEVLYYIAENKELEKFQAVYKWMAAKNQLQEEPLIAAVGAKNLAAARWVCEINPEIASIGGQEAIELAIKNNDLPMLQLLVHQGSLQGSMDLQGAMSFVIKKDDPELFIMLLNAIKYDLSTVLAPQIDQIIAAPERKILKTLIGKQESLSSLEVDRVLQTMITLFGQDLKLMPTSLLFYLLQHGKTAAEWEEQLTLAKKICDSYSEELKMLVEPNEFFKQIFEEIFDKFQKKLVLEENIVERLFTLLQKVQTKAQVALYFNALQRGCPLNDLALAIDASKEKEASGVPSLDQFRQLTKDKKIQWLTYFAVSGFRGGFDICWQSIREENDPDVIRQALQGLEKIGMTIPLKKIKDSLSVYFDYPNESVRCQAVKTLSAVVGDTKCEYSKQIILSQLYLKNSKETILTLIQLVGNFDYSSSDFPSHILALSRSDDRDIRIQSALTLSRIRCEAALVRATEIVKSPDWDFMDEFFGDDRKFFPGAWWLFIYPPEFHDSRSAILSRIRDQLAVIHKEKIEAKVQERLQAFEKEPDSFPDLSKLSKDLRNLPRSCRYIPIPIYFPTTPGSYLLRGLKARKGDALFHESVRDLIRKGCGKSDLTCFDEQFTCGSWSKIGQIFATHTIHLAHQYFEEAQGCLILVDPAYYNSQYQKGMARTENEVSINNVLYQGIPKNAIKLIYISKEFEHDLCMLNSDKAIDDKFKARLTSDAFRNCSLKELSQHRTYLHEKMEPLTGPFNIHNQMYHKTFFNVFRFIEPDGTPINERLDKDGVREISIEEIETETVKAAIGRQVAIEELAPVHGSGFFLSQDEMLSQLNDEGFKSNLPELFTLLHLDRLPFKETRARHGHSNGRRVSAYEHTIETIVGKHGGFGLNTDLKLTSLNSEKTRRILRLAALYHYVGHLPQEGEKKGSLVERSSVLAKSEMLKQLKLQGISSSEASLISQLILHNGLFGNYLMGKISHTQLEQQLSVAYEVIHQEFNLTKADFIKMLWALFTARASTLSKVAAQKTAYKPYLDFANLDCSSLQWINTLRYKIDGKAPISDSNGIQLTPVEPKSWLSTLWASGDADFKKQLPVLITANQQPLDYFNAFSGFPCGHGRTPEGNRVNLLEHTLEVICGNFGGFGLNTSINVQALSPDQIKKILRLTALFHDSGKIEGRSGHIERSAEFAVKEMSKARELWDVTDEEITLIKHTIIGNDVFGLYLRSKSTMSHQDLLATLNQAYEALKKELKTLNITSGEFRKLMFTFWIADASTLTVVNRTLNHLYKPVLEKLDTMDYDSLEDLHILQGKIQQGRVEKLT